MDKLDNIEEKYANIILFDGVCNLCNGAVQFVIRHDKKNIFHFAALQSEVGSFLLQAHGLSDKTFNSFVLLSHKKLYAKSTAALHVLRILGWPLKFFYGFIIVPSFIRDGVYNLVSKYRYKWFGKQEACMIPTPALKQKFLG